ncbi:MAG: thioesterase family protein [Anaerolineae bacterium]|nr:thioesterase family protein [Anaerolineae bacterium]
MSITVGLKGERAFVVEEKHTAYHLGSGGVHVFSTPSMVSLMEGAAVNAIDPFLPEGQMSVGIEISAKHLAATPIGKRVRAEAEVIGVDKRRVMFTIKAWDEHELIGEATHTRFIIDLDRYTQRLDEKK